MVKDKVTIIDTVDYKNLEVAQRYHVIGVLMDKETGKELLIDGKKVTAEASFKAEKANGTVDEIQERCIKTLKEDSDAYGKILNETSQLLDKYDFINTLSARDEIQEPKNLTILEWQALERFMALEEDRRDFEAIQIYLFGCQHTLAMLLVLCQDLVQVKMRFSSS